KFKYKSGACGWSGFIREYYGIYLRKEFELLKPIKKAKVYICGLGFYELRINGEKVSDRLLEPAITDYEKISLYSTIDISELLKDRNAIGVILGNGRYLENYDYYCPKLIMQIYIEFKDGSHTLICSDEMWKISQGPILENGLYYGEKYDARLEMPGWDKDNFDDSTWDNVITIDGPQLASQMIQPIRINKILEPQKLYSPKAGIYIFDFGQNFTGFVRLKVHGPRGTEVIIRHSEIVDNNGMLNLATNGDAKATDIYILKGEGIEIFEPHFTYHGFRYVELTNFPGVPTVDNIKGLFIHTNVSKTGDFYCSNELINKIHKNIVWGQLSNMMSIPTDCPQRHERQGWLGDAQLIIEEAIFNFDVARFFSKFLRDIRLSQIEDGSLPDVVPPYWKFYPADPAWGTAYIVIAWYLYWYYDDVKILEDNFEFMKKYVNFLSSQSEDGLILYKLGKWGDWCPPGSIVSRKTPIEHVCTWYYYHDTLHLSKIAQILGREQEYEELSLKAEKIKEAYNQTFFKNATYEIPKLSLTDRTISQTSIILPLYLEMVPKNLKNMVILTLLHSIIEDHDYHLDTGIVGTRYLFDVLSENEKLDVAYKIITQTSYPGYGYMIKEGATTLWERWEKLEGFGMNSHNHIMLGTVDTWFFKYLAGIKSLDVAWKKIRIKPYIPSEIHYVSASLNTIKGYIYSSWEKINSTLNFTIKIPVGCVSEIWIPNETEKYELKERDISFIKNGEIIDTIIGIEFKEIKDNHIILKGGSGDYQFHLIQSD
ncbi:MAG: family 78 glycoside hydrolase catalytic domain, partial [Candidatus Hermodarchaeota archaeon]